MAERPILIASDLSPRNDRAVDRAIMLGRQLSRPVCLVHVRKEGADEDDRGEIERFIRAGLPDPDADIEILLPTGPVPQEIGMVADEWHAALIVCAVARFNDFHDYITGTAVDRIVTRGRRPVLVVKQRPHSDYRKLMVAVDFSNHSAHALACAARLFPEAEMVVVHAYKVAYEGLQKGAHLRDETREMHEASMKEFLARPELACLKGRVRTELAYGDIGQALLGAAKDLAPDLVVAGTHGAGGLRRAALGSIASQMLQWMPHDMLVVPPED